MMPNIYKYSTITEQLIGLRDDIHFEINYLGDLEMHVSYTAHLTYVDHTWKAGTFINDSKIN
jgi:hypothetical protein